MSNFNNMDDRFNERLEDPIPAVCRGCGEECDEGFKAGEIKYHHWARADIYGIYTGIYCDDCYNGVSGNYPYRKDEYFDTAYCGETMDEEDY
jgi:hypothetical protein